MLPSFSVRRLGSLCRSLSRPSQSPPFRVPDRRFTSVAKFNEVVDETLESLHEYFDELCDRCQIITDNELKDGVLTVSFRFYDPITYVMNRQTVNLQLWLSSPISGPKRFDYFEKEDAWIYRRTEQSLHQLLQHEISDIVEENVDFFKCVHCGRAKV